MSDSEEEQQVGDPSEVKPSYWCHSKKRYAVMFAYSGIGYHGLQVDPSYKVKTIEGDLEKAICESGVIKKENIGDLKKSKWSRAARTDKGVHAVGQVITLKMGLKEDDASRAAFVDRLNELLPKQIRVYDAVRTTKSFNAKNSCSGRKYEYLLPTFLFRPRPFQTKSEFRAAQIAEKEEDEGLAGGAVDDEDDEGALKEEETKKTAQSDEEKQFFATFRAEAQASFKFDEALKKKLLSVLQTYVGTHPFHNFTLKVAPDDPAAKRHIKSITLDGPMVIDGLEVVRINIEGQSFMLHQIRKMVACAIETVRRGLPISVLADHFKPTRVATPMVPGEGLALRACLFSQYNHLYGNNDNNKSSGKGHKRPVMQSYPSLDFDKPAIIDRADKFRLEVLYPVMVAQEMESNVFARYVYHQEFNDFPSSVEKKSLNYREYRDKDKERLRQKNARKGETSAVRESSAVRDLSAFIGGGGAKAKSDTIGESAPVPAKQDNDRPNTFDRSKQHPQNYNSNQKRSRDHHGQRGNVDANKRRAVDPAAELKAFLYARTSNTK